MLLLVSTFSIANFALAQDRISSPYSRFGLGELFQSTHANNMAMGGISTGVYNRFFVNPSNPASYSAFDSLSFVFDLGLYTKFSDFSTTSQSQSATFTSLGNLSFGFPVTNWWRGAFGLIPYSATGYKMTDYHTDTIFDNYRNVYEGKGGVNQFFIGSSFDITRNLSVGLNVSYLFGTTDRSTATVFPDSLYRFNVKRTNSARVHDLVLNYGLMYHRNLNKGYHLTVGASFFAKSNVNVKADKIAYTYTSSSLGVDNIRDTLLLENNSKEEITLPMGIGAGLSFGRGSKWLVGGDFSYKQWEDFKFFAAPEPLANNMQFAVGGFYNPSVSTVSNYFNRVTYRAGVRYSDGFLELRDQRINEFGISFGVGLPLPRTNSTINLAVEVGSRGTKNENLIQENYVKFTLGLSIFERWFVIRKYE
jgi:hypothetical protein